MNPQIINHEIQIEPLATRVALHPFLAGMNHTQLTLLTDCAVARHFNANQTILRESEFANGFYLVETGKVALESETGLGRSIPVQILGVGDLLGWSWMFPPYRWHFGATAEGPVLAISFDGPGIRALCTAEPELGYELTRRLIQVVVERMQATRMRMLELYSEPT